MTTPADPRAVTEYKVRAVDLKVGDVVDTGDQDWQEVIGVYTSTASVSDEKLRSVVETLDGRYVLAQLTDIDPVDGGVYFAAGLAMVTGDEETADRTVAVSSTSRRAATARPSTAPSGRCRPTAGRWWRRRGRPSGRKA